MILLLLLLHLLLHLLLRLLLRLLFVLLLLPLLLLVFRTICRGPTVSLHVEADPFDPLCLHSDRTGGHGQMRQGWLQ